MGKINTLLISLAFASGIGTGYYLGKRKYETLADTEVESLKRYYENNYILKNETEPIEEKPVEDKTKRPKKALGKSDLDLKNEMTDYKDYSGQYQSQGSNKRIPGEPIPNSNVEKELTEEGRRNSEGPYIITPGEFNESTYEAHTLFFYADRVLADDDFNIVDDIVGTIGEEALGAFGMYEEDCVYIRNDELEIDYEILIDERYFAKASNRSVPGLKDSE